MSSAQEKVDDWLSGPYDEETKNAIRNLSEQEKIDAFYTDISFGTGGMRGLMGVGTNRINRYTIQKATQGFANYLKKMGATHGIVIGHDSRHNSRLFAEEAAKVLAANGIEVWLTPDLRPTPFVSFACRHLGCSGAIMITASHNPKEYNGYKVYWSDGAQVVAPHDRGIIEEVNKVQGPIQLADSPIHILGEDVDQAYLESLKFLENTPDENYHYGKDLKVIYTPLHGTGITLLPKAFAMWGFNNLHFVEEQKEPHGDFPAAPSPNPEQKEALELGVKKLREDRADLLLATDPDADRMGAVVMHKGKPTYLTGNAIASLLLFHICKNSRLPKNGAVVSTIVTTELLSAITRSFNLAYFEVLTGFKYIGEKIRLWEEEKHPYSFVFGAEESYGYLYGTYARDKDGIAASCLLAEAALHSKREGKTLVDVLHQIFKQYGVFQEKQYAAKFPEGKEGSEAMQRMMGKLRKNPPNNIIEMTDYQTGIKMNLQTQKEEKIDLPTSNVLAFRFEDESRVVVRPSGTEPKIKVYAMVQEHPDHSVEDAILHANQRLDHLLENIKTYLT